MAVTVVNPANPIIYTAFEGDSFPDASLLPDGSLCILIHTGNPQVWIVKAGLWALQNPSQYVIALPLNPALNTIGLAVPAVSATIPAASTQRQVVAIGGAINTTETSYLDQMLVRIEDSLNAILTEMRLANLQLQGMSISPILDDLDTLRPSMLNPDETLTR